MSVECTICVAPDGKIISDNKSSHKYDILGNELHKNLFNVLIGRKQSYLIYRHTELLGYCHSLNYSLDIVRSLVGPKIKAGQKYKIVVKHIDPFIKIYFYEVSEGMFWNSDVLVEKYRLQEIPKIELSYDNYKTFTDSESTKVKENDYNCM